MIRPVWAVKSVLRMCMLLVGVGEVGVGATRLLLRLGLDWSRLVLYFSVF